VRKKWEISELISHFFSHLSYPEEKLSIFKNGSLSKTTIEMWENFSQKCSMPKKVANHCGLSGVQFCI